MIIIHAIGDCPRCGTSSKEKIQSVFTGENICLSCIETEQHHPEYNHRAIEVFEHLTNAHFILSFLMKNENIKIAKVRFDALIKITYEDKEEDLPHPFKRALPAFC